jgi:hypothetical protein
MSVYKFHKCLNIKYISILCFGITLLFSSGKMLAQATKVVSVVIEIIQPVGATFNAERFADMKGYTPMVSISNNGKTVSWYTRIPQIPKG